MRRAEHPTHGSWWEPDPWTRWDHLVFRVTGRVSDRVYADRMACMARNDMDARLEAELERRTHLKATYLETE